MITAALAGQPNCGKSTIFNMLAGVNQHVANYPGVTVDKKTATARYNDIRFEFVDLPGTYSFSTFSLEERVAKAFLMDEAPDIIINIIDAANLRRSLYLTFQLLELGKPVVVVLNMMDIARRRSMEIDTDKLSELLNVDVVTTIGSRRQGREELLAIAGRIFVGTQHVFEQAYGGISRAFYLADQASIAGSGDRGFAAIAQARHEAIVDVHVDGEQKSRFQTFG